MPKLELHAPFEPAGDQPTAIATLVEGLQNGKEHQVLLGIVLIQGICPRFDS